MTLDRKMTVFYAVVVVALVLVSRSGCAAEQALDVTVDRRPAGVLKIVNGSPAPQSGETAVAAEYRCAVAAQQAAESRRLMRNAFLAFSASFAAQMFDVATTAKAKHDFGCATHSPCLIEENRLFPLTAGLIAGKAAWVVLTTVAEYMIDRLLGPQHGWLKFLHWGPSVGGSADGVYQAVRNLQNIHQLQREATR